MIRRHRTRQVRVGGVKIGGGAPVSIQSMTKVPTSETRRSIGQIKKLEAAGCEIVRVAVKTQNDAAAIREIKRKIKIPLVADIHFNHRLALASIASGADKIRINPGNMRGKEDVSAVVRAAKRAGIPIRIGVNSGSVFTKYGRRNTDDRLVDSALKYIRLFESLDFRDIILSLKSSDVQSTVEAYRRISGLCGYPLHLGVTAAGPYETGVVKNAVGIGALLLDGIGDTIRVSLTADPAMEVAAARNILSAAGSRKFGPEIVSCPTCGRGQVDLAAIVKELERKIHSTRSMTIAVMGCEVNGPGEAKEADVGIAFGKGSGIIFKNGKMIKKVDMANAVKELLETI